MAVARPLQKIAVIGAGVMGAGIALVAAAADHDVTLYDADPLAARRGISRLETELRSRVERGKLTRQLAEAHIAKISVADDIAELADAALVIEAIIEDLDIKAAVLTRLEPLLSPTALIASNTSSLSITALAARLSRPQRVAGLHFFNPPGAMKLVEIVSGARTDPAVAQTLADLARSWGKIPVSCRSTPGFIVNRVARPFYGEALRLLTDQAATPVTLDAIMRECGGFRMGPCALMDLIGHDVNFAVTRAVFEANFAHPRYRPSLLQQELVQAGLLGRKSGHGFFNYTADAILPLPANAVAGAPPAPIAITGPLGPAASLTPMLAGAGIDVAVRQEGAGMITIGEVDLFLTDGRTADARASTTGRPVALFDLALDYGRATRIAVAFSTNMTQTQQASVTGLFQALGKHVSVIDDVPGLVVARTVAMIINEAADGVLQALASAADIDAAMIHGANYPIGPLAWADQLGAPWVVAMLDALSSATPDGRYGASPLLRRQTATGGRFCA